MKRELEKALEAAELVTSKTYRDDLKQLLIASKRKFLVERDSGNRPGRFLARMLAGADADTLSLVKDYVNSGKDVPKRLAARWLGNGATDEKKRGRHSKFEEALDQRIEDYCCFKAMSYLTEKGMKQKPAARKVAEMMDRPEKPTRSPEAVLQARRRWARRWTDPWK